MDHDDDRVGVGAEDGQTPPSSGDDEGLTRHRLLQDGLLASTAVWQTPTMITWRSQHALPVSPPPAAKEPPQPPKRPKRPAAQRPKPPVRGHEAPAARPAPKPPILAKEITPPRRPGARRPQVDIAVTGADAATLAGVGGAALTAGTAAIVWAKRLQRSQAHGVGEVEASGVATPPSRPQPDTQGTGSHVGGVGAPWTAKRPPSG